MPTPLVQKLGLKAGFRIKVWGAPPHYGQLLDPLPADIEIGEGLGPPVDAWHLFTHSRSELEHLLPLALQEIRQDGMIWISWPKKASGIESEVNGNVIREIALPTGLVDVKVCAVDETWSGLKLMIRRVLRK